MIGASAQVSIYPLRQERLSTAIEEALHILQEHGLEVQPGPMSTLVRGEDDAIFAAIRSAFGHAAERGEVVMVVTLSNACPVGTPDLRPGRRSS